jgi:hypothetical protein
MLTNLGLFHHDLEVELLFSSVIKETLSSNQNPFILFLIVFNYDSLISGSIFTSLLKSLPFYTTNLCVLNLLINSVPHSKWSRQQFLTFFSQTSVTSPMNEMIESLFLKPFFIVEILKIHKSSKNNIWYEKFQLSVTQLQLLWTFCHSCFIHLLWAPLLL